MENEQVNFLEMTPAEFMRPRCKVGVGDRIYRRLRNMTIPDRMEVIEVKPMKDVENGYFIKCRYMYHAIGAQERTFSDIIFKDDDWVIEKKGVDF